MSTLAESLKRLYSQGKITIEKLDTMKADGNVTQEEYDYITT
jgi:hypothetical protein